jgi:hypothetical protein
LACCALSSFQQIICSTLGSVVDPKLFFSAIL